MTSMKYAFGLFFILLVSALFAQGLDLCPSGATNDSQVMIVPSEDGKTITISVLAFDLGTTPPGTSTREKYEQWATDCAGEPDFMNCMTEKGLEANSHIGTQQINYESIRGAHVVVQYYNPMGNTYHGQWTDVPACADLQTTDSATGHKTDAAGNSVDYTYYTVECPLQDVANNQINTFRVIFVPDDATTCPSAAEYQYENRDITPATEFLQVMQNLIAGVSESELTTGGSLPCLGVFLIMGLLLASLYFAGKSPVTLLDITTPRLPTPKGVTASGQILAPFGYTEMKQTTRDKMRVAGLAMGATANELAKSRSGDSDLDKLKKSIKSQKTELADKMTGAAAMAQEKAAAVSIVTAGRSVGLTAKEMEGLAKMPYHYNDADQKTVQRIIELLEKKGGRHALMASTLKDYMYGQRTFQSLEVLTAHPDVGKRSAMHYALTNTLGKFYGSNRYAVLGGVVMAGTDSTVRSARLMGRMVKSIATEAPSLARQTTKSTMELMGGKRAMDDLKARARTSSAAAWMAGQLEKHPSTVVVGNMFPVNDKMGHLYRTLHKEALCDDMRYVMRQLYKKMGMNFNMSAEELASMGHTDMDILKKAGYTDAVKEMDAKIRGILTDHAKDPQQKLDALMGMAKDSGVHIDQAAVKFSQRLTAIEGSGEPEHVKMLSLQQLLEEQNKVRMAAGSGALRDDAFVSHVGGDSLRGHQVWETMVLRTMAWDGENGHLQGGIKEELLSARLNVVNRLTSLDPTIGMEQLPEHMRNPNQLKAVAERNRTDLIQLFSKEGIDEFKRYAANKPGTSQNIHTASLAQLVDFMSGGTMQRTSHIDSKTGKMVWWGGADFELALPKNATLVDVKRHWVAGLNSQENFAIGQWVESRFTKSYVPAYKASIEAELNRMPGSASWTNEQRTQAAKKIWVADQLAQDMEQRFNSHFGQNTYGTTRETTRFYGGIMAGFMEKALQEKGLESNHPDLRFLQEMDTTNPKHLAKLKELMRTYATEYASILSRDMTYDDLAKSSKAVVMLHEGGYAYYHKGMMLSDMDRVMAGETALRDDKGQLRKFIPEEVAVKFAARDDLTSQYAKVRSSKDPNEWTTFVESSVKWAKEGGYNFDRQKVLAAVLWEYGNATHDYARFWKDSAVAVEAKRQVAPVAPASLRFFGVDGHNQSHMIKPFRDIALHGGDYISKIALASGGSLLKTSYDITAVSEAYRQHSMKNAVQIFQTLNNKNTAAGLSDAERVAYRAVAMQHGAYHQVWDYAIDRNPWRTSTSYGTHQAWGSFFHFGPAVPFNVRDNLRAYMDRGTYTNFMAGYGFGMDFAGKLMKPYINVLRGVQMSMQGYASKWDSTGDALRQWNYTPPRITEAMQSINPFSARWFKGKTGERISKLNVFGGSLEQHQLAGPEYQAGLKQAPQDIFLQRKGVYASARTGETNPGASYLNYRAEMVLDSPMAEYMFRAKESAFMYDKGVQKAAMDNTARRTVSAEALAIRRDQELRSFGVLQNSLFGWASPIGFAWHVPVPGFPQGLSPKDQVTKYMARSKTGHGGSFSDGIKRMAEGISQGTSRMLQPHKMAMVVYCPKCGTPNYRGSSCKNTSCKQVQY